MQLIGEAYNLFRDALGYDAGQVADVFTEWNKGTLESYLIEITAEVLRQVDAETGKPLVDVIVGRCRAEGNGPLDGQVCSGSGRAGHRYRRSRVCSRTVRVAAISALQLRRRVWLPALSATSLLTPSSSPPTSRPRCTRRRSWRTRRAYDQIAAGSAEYDWNLKPADLATIWRGGCIIRAQFLNRIKDAFDADPSLPSLILAPYFREAIEAGIDSWRRVVATATMLGIPVPAFASSLSYYDGLRAERLPAALTQGQRDFFGAHTYERIDKPGKFHTLWSGDRSEIEA